MVHSTPSPLKGPHRNQCSSWGIPSVHKPVVQPSAVSYMSPVSPTLPKKCALQAPIDRLGDDILAITWSVFFLRGKGIR